MNDLKDALSRLICAAAEARRKASAEPVEGPSAVWLLARTQQRHSIPPDVFLVFRRGLTAACILLIATGLVAAHEIREQQAGVLNLAGAAQFQVSDAFVP